MLFEWISLKKDINVEILNIRFIPPHAHSDAIEMIYCMSGNITINVAHEEISLSPGEILTCDNDDIHFIYSDADNIVLILHMKMELKGYSFEELDSILFSCATAYCNEYKSKAMEAVYDYILSIAYIYISEDSPSSKKYEPICHNLLHHIIDNFSWFSVAELSIEDNIKYRSRLNDISLYAQNNYWERITMPEVADLVHLDSNYLSQFMKRTAFTSFTNMINYFRCYEANRMLLEAELSVQEISDLCGFSSKNYFHKYYKKWWNTTPLQQKIRFRKLKEKEKDVTPYSPKEISDTVLKLTARRQLERLSATKII